MKLQKISAQALANMQMVDQTLSNRFIALDPYGYFIIRLDYEEVELIVEHYPNDIDDFGRAIDPVSGKPITCSEDNSKGLLKIFRGKTAKEVGTKLTEGEGPYSLSKLDHALYLGRELQRAESCLRAGVPYVQD